VSVRDDKLYAAQAAPRQLPEEGRPEGVGLGRADIHAQKLALAICIDTNRHDDGDRDDAAGLEDLHVGGVDPQIRPVALDRPVEEALDPSVAAVATVAGIPKSAGISGELMGPPLIIWPHAILELPFKCRKRGLARELLLGRLGSYGPNHRI
jgi:hypothetical protein